MPTVVGRMQTSSPAGTGPSIHRAVDASSLAFIELRGAKPALLATALYATLVHLLLAHDAELGSFWCPLSACQPMLVAPLGLLLTQRRLFAAVALFLDFFVLVVHWWLPVHPKFVVVPRRRLCIRIHILSGTFQAMAGPAFYALHLNGHTGASRLICIAIAAIGLCVHTPTALYLLRSAFGAVRLTIPVFIYATAAYGYTLGRLLLLGLAARADLLEHAFLAYWLCLHVYVMNRICFSVLTRFNLLAHSRYDLAILLGAAVVFPASLGWATLLLTLIAVVVFNLIFVLLMDPSSQSTSDIFSAGGFANQALVREHFVAPEGLVVAPMKAASRCVRRRLGLMAYVTHLINTSNPQLTQR